MLNNLFASDFMKERIHLKIYVLKILTLIKELVIKDNFYMLV